MSKISLTPVGVVAFLGCLASIGCPSGPPSQCRAFLDLPVQSQQSEFRSYPVEKQLDLYLCAMKSQPPTSSFAYQIAEQGEGVIPLVMQKLKTSKSEVEQRDLIYLLEVMSNRGYLRQRKDVIAEVAQIIDGMTNPSSKELSAERLQKIQINSGIKPFTYIPQKQ